jgi:hypothetical protein
MKSITSWIPAVAAMLLHSASSHGAVLFQTEIFYEGELDWSASPAETGPLSFSNSSGTSSSSAYQPTVFRNTINVFAEASPGKLRSRSNLGLGSLQNLEIITTDPDGGPIRSMEGRASASMEDVMTVHAAGKDGEIGFVRFRIVVSGTLSTSLSGALGQGYATWFLGAAGAFVSDPVYGNQLMPDFDTQGDAQIDYDQVNGSRNLFVIGNNSFIPDVISYGHNTTGATVEFNLPIYFGQAFSFGLKLDVSSGISMNPDTLGLPLSDTRVASGHGYSSFGNTADLYVLDILDENGDSLDPLATTLDSGSGHMYVIPEPSTALCLGAAVLACLVRRKRAVL